MNKPYPALHRVVCKSLLVCDEDGIKPKRPARPRRPEDVKKAAIELKSAQPVHSSNGGSAHRILNTLKESELNGRLYDVPDSQELMQKAASDSNGPENRITETATALTQKSVSGCRDDDFANNKMLDDFLGKADRRERKAISTERKVASVNQVFSHGEFQSIFPHTPEDACVIIT